MKILTSLFTIILLLGTGSVALAQSDSLNLHQMTHEEILSLSQDDLLTLDMEDLLFLAQKLGMSIDELLNLKTNVASSQTFSPRETPGIVSFITSDEIKYSGARDLMDVLRLVPGFDFGYDVQGVVGVGLRGNWVHEGKILLMIDGQQMNEISYYNIPFGNHFAVDQIKRIEIIRGPGSAKYGGNAELGVIHIITKKGSDLKGVEASGTYGQMQKSPGRANANINAGFTTGKWDISAKGFVGEAKRSDQTFIEYVGDYGNAIDLSKESSRIKTRNFNLGADNGAFSARFLYDDYKSYYLYYDEELSGNTGAFTEFRTIMGEMKYAWKLHEKITLTPRISYKYNRPYYEEGYWRNFRNNRYIGSLTLNYQPSKKLNLMEGIEWYTDRGSMIGDTGHFYSNLGKHLNIENFSFFGEASYKLNKINLIGGFRVEHNSLFGWAGAPRIGATGVFDNFHVKALISCSFRSPGIGNIDVASKIEPEKSLVTEIELGYRLNEYMFITANIYDIQTRNSIIYFDNGGWDPGTDWGYENADEMGSDGLELEYKALFHRGYATINYSFYTQAFRPLHANYAVPGEDNAALAFPQHKIGLNLAYMPVRDLHLAPSMAFLGKRYGYTDVDAEDNPAVSAFDPCFLLNFCLTYDNLLVKGLSLSLSGYDLLNQRPSIIQPYNGWFYPFPGRSREFLVKLTITSDVLKRND